MILRRALFFSSVWLILSKADPDSWPFAIPSILIATWVSALLAVPNSQIFRPAILLAYTPYFAWKSLVSGVDVMVRVLHPALPIQPGLIYYTLSPGHESARVLLANCVTMLPGTISAQISDDQLVIHTLDKNMPIEATVNKLEKMVTDIFPHRTDPDTELMQQ